MQDLRLVGVHDDGEHLVLADSDGNQFRVPIDAELRDATRRQGTSVVTTARARTVFDDGSRRSSGGSGRSVEVDETMRPRDIQAMLRAGASVEEAAERSGWPHEKVERYAAPIQAERGHIAGMVRALTLRGRAGTTDSTFDDRVSQRLVARGVDPEQAEWDSWKGDQGRWNVVCRFPAGGRQRQATWLFDPADRTISATDDEARWLGEDDQSAGPVGPVPAAAPRRRNEPVYDVEAEGGLEDGPVTVRRRGGGTAVVTQVPPEPADGAGDDGSEADDPVDLVSAMRERAGRRRKGRRHGRSTAPAGPANRGETPDDAQPQEHVDVESAAQPPLGSHPAPEELGEADAPAAEAAPPDHDPVTGTAQLFPDETFGDSAGGQAEVTDEAAAPAERPARRKKKKSRSRAAKQAGPEADERAEEQVTSADEPAPEPAETDQPDDTGDETTDSGATPPQRPSAARRGRPSVPSWDDIMFGSKGTTH